MKVKKILNNNVIVTNSQSKEISVMGKGLAFGLKIGNVIDKIFSLTNSRGIKI